MTDRPTRTTALACGHWLDRGGDEDIPPGARCEKCGEPVHALVTWPLDAEGNRILFTGPVARLAGHGEG